MDAPALTSVVLLPRCWSHECVVRPAVQSSLYQVGKVGMSVHLVVCAAPNVVRCIREGKVCTFFVHIASPGLIHTGATSTQWPLSFFPAVAAEFNGTR